MLHNNATYDRFYLYCLSIYNDGFSKERLMQSKQFITSDLSLAAFLVMSGIKLLSCSKTNNGKFEFYLDDPDDRAPGLSMSYLNSDFCKFDNQVRILKKMLYKN